MLTFRARCLHCGVLVVSEVKQLAEAELRELREHLARCTPRISYQEDDAGVLLLQFDITSHGTEGGAM